MRRELACGVLVLLVSGCGGSAFVADPPVDDAGPVLATDPTDGEAGVATLGAKERQAGPDATPDVRGLPVAMNGGAVNAVDSGIEARSPLEASDPPTADAMAHDAVSLPPIEASADAPVPCLPSTCAGCCDGTLCRPGSLDTACGAGGQLCNDCTTMGQRCSLQACAR
jgi:hypothetical protein